MEWNSHPLIITVAPCGAEVTREHNPAVPYTPAEVAEQAAGAVEAGAAIVHLHARESDGRPTHRGEVYSDIIEKIRERCDVICNVSTGGAVWMTMEQRTECLDSGAEMTGVEPGSLNFDGDPFVTSRADGQRIVERALERGMILEAECFDMGHVADAPTLLNGTILADLPMYNLVVGVRGGAPATLAGLQGMIAALPDGARWSLTAVGRQQTRMLSMAILLGAHGVRVGFEDNVYLSRGRLARSNAEIVTHIRQIAEILGRRIATVNEVRKALGVPGNHG